MASAAVGPARSRSIGAQDRMFGAMISAPGILALLLIILFPIGFAAFTSVHDYTLIRPNFEFFTGQENYVDTVAQPYLRTSVLVTIKYVLASILIEFAIGFIVALMLNSVVRFKSVYYFILLIPLLINPVVVGLMWRMILHSELGIANYLLGLASISPVNWLGDVNIAFWTVVIVDVWHQVSFMAILLLAGLAALPKEPYEAARMDGATFLQSFIYITVPLMRPVIVVTLLLRTIFAVKTFDIVFVMTRGGPGTATDLISYYIYRTAFFGLDIGKASAISIMLLIVVLGMTASLYKFLNTNR